MRFLRNILSVSIINLLSLNCFAQTDILGEWIVGKQNSIIKIEQQNGIYSGKLTYSNNAKAQIGKPMVKELKQMEDSWEGKLYVPKRDEWYEATFVPIGNKLNITILVGPFSKSVEWIKK
ncbi:DUF2147 domain-containing protein [Pleionea sediminis]|uniref:DUF2147 domain-containing protein n=1 Tax=Pleionea sediminis TaxID=2569479 RepID=UPI0013DE075C|nr:DUF2147 domain-containing protein [Pleionea sediminis]